MQNRSRTLVSRCRKVERELATSRTTGALSEDAADAFGTARDARSFRDVIAQVMTDGDNALESEPEIEDAASVTSSTMVDVVTETPDSGLETSAIRACNNTMRKWKRPGARHRKVHRAEPRDLVGSALEEWESHYDDGNAPSGPSLRDVQVHAERSQFLQKVDREEAKHAQNALRLDKLRRDRVAQQSPR